MGIAKQFKAALPLGFLFAPSATDRRLAQKWLEAELRRRDLLRKALENAEGTVDPVAIAAHRAALNESEKAVVWLEDRLAEWSAAAAR